MQTVENNLGKKPKKGGIQYMYETSFSTLVLKVK